MKRYRCPECRTEYQDEPAECPICLYSVGESGPMKELYNPANVDGSALAVTKNNAIECGFAGYNNCTHLCVDVPDGFFTISARLSDGRRVTFAFTPYEENAPSQAVDILYHDPNTYVLNGERKVPVQNVILFDRGNKTMVPPTTTCTTLLLYDREAV
jgi:hypothetical protein